MINDKLTVQALVGRLWDEGIPATILLTRGEADILLQPNDRLTHVANLLAQEELDLSFNGSEIHVTDRRAALPDESVPA